MLDVSTTTLDADLVTKRYSVWNEGVRAYFEREAEFSRLLAEAGLGPEVVEVGEAWIITRRGDRLADVLDPDPSKNRWAGEALLDAIGTMHRFGMAHRDVQRGNLLVTAEGRILFVDCELACRVDPNLVRPYDLYGPGSGTPAPETHRHQQIAAYWDSETVDDAPWRWCGRLEEYL